MATLRRVRCLASSDVAIGRAPRGATTRGRERGDEQHRVHEVRGDIAGAKRGCVAFDQSEQHDPGADGRLEHDEDDGCDGRAPRAVASGEEAPAP